MLGLDLSETTEVIIADARWTIGLLPLAKYYELTDALDDAQRPFQAHVRGHLRSDGSLNQEDHRACEVCRDLLSVALRQLRPTYREAVRWGLRDTDAPALAIPTETVSLAGRDYRVAGAAFVERLARVAQGTLVQRLALAILSANQLDAREVLGFK